MLALTDTRVEWNDVIEKIQRIPQYRSEVSINLVTHSPEKLHPLCLFVRSYRLAKTKELVAAYDAKGVPLFRPVHITSDNGNIRMLLPPIIEVNNDKRVIIDGLHRIYECVQLKRPEIHVIQIEGKLEPLPADVLDWQDVSITDLRLPRELKFRNFRSEYFRPINAIIDEFQ